MNFKKIFEVLVFTIFLWNCNSQTKDENGLQIIPLPSHSISVNWYFILNRKAEAQTLDDLEIKSFNNFIR